MTFLIPETGISSKQIPLCAFCDSFIQLVEIMFSISALTILPPGPLPLMLERSIPFWFAILFANGEAFIFCICISWILDSCAFSVGSSIVISLLEAVKLSCDVFIFFNILDMSSSVSFFWRIIALGVFTATSFDPSLIIIFASVPLYTDSTSIVALSVSISAIISPTSIVSPSFFFHDTKLPFSIVGLSAGISKIIGIRLFVFNKNQQYDTSC